MEQIKHVVGTCTDNHTHMDLLDVVLLVTCILVVGHLFRLASNKWK